MTAAAPVMIWLGVLPGWAASARTCRTSAASAVMAPGEPRQAITLGKPGCGQGTAMQAIAGSRTRWLPFLAPVARHESMT